MQAIDGGQGIVYQLGEDGRGFRWMSLHTGDLRVEFLLKTESGYLRDAGVP